MYVFKISKNVIKDHLLMSYFSMNRSSCRKVFCKKGVLENFVNSQEYNFIKKGTLEQAFSCEFFEIFMNTFFNRTPLVDTSEWSSRLAPLNILLMVFEFIAFSSVGNLIEGIENKYWKLSYWAYFNLLWRAVSACSALLEK